MTHDSIETDAYVVTMSNYAAQKHSTSCFCSYAITGPQESFQPIYVCHTCSTCNNTSNTADNNFLVCICQACADECHEDHADLAYIGMGPCYCDCQAMTGKCQLQEKSEEEARRLSMNGLQLHSDTVPAAPLVWKTENSYSRYVLETFTIDTLQDSRVCTQLGAQIRELVQYSKETFWLETDIPYTQLCGLERLAQIIFKQNCAHFCLDIDKCGAEWWVQVKPVGGKNAKNKSQEEEEAAIDLHYDKDEVMAESFGLGYFPALSTVTYLTNPSCSASPTIVFERQYSENEDNPIHNMLLSHIDLGKHLVFDGRLLHGAPSHYSLRQNQKKSGFVELKSPTTLLGNNCDRITLLVNIWYEHKPAGVNPLSSDLRDRLRHIDFDRLSSLPYPTFIQRRILERHVPENFIIHSPRIELPFVGKGSTWADDEDDDRMTVSLVPPPQQHDDDTVLYHFAYDVAAYLCVPDIGQFEEDERKKSGCVSNAC